VANGEYTQVVDIVPGKLKVTFRTVSSLESQEIRLWIWKRAAENPELTKLTGDMYGLALIVASVKQINGTAYPDHLKRTGAGVWGAQFDVEAFVGKYSQFLNMAMPLIHAIGTHSQWFDLRIREMFTIDYAKNG
jgi:hypothetical protein